MANNPKDFPKHMQYALDVAAGKIVASRAVLLQCERSIEEHKRGFVEETLYGETSRYVWKEEKASGRINFINQCPHPKGRWRANKETITLQPWQEYFIGEVYGWVDVTDDRIRRYREAILFVGRKNGKTTLIAPLGLHETAWGDEGAEVYCAATKSEQSKILWAIAIKMIDLMTPRLNSLFRVKTNEISSMKGEFMHLPSKSTTQDGLNPSLALFDESAAIEDSNQIHVLESGMAARDSPLALHLTTAQPTRTTLFRSRYQLAKRGLESGKIPASLFALLYELDDAEEIHNPDNWIKANPNLGVSIPRRTLASAIEKSQDNPRERSLMLCKHFNIWSEYETAWLSVDLWEACKGEPVRNGEMYIGLDLAESRDLTAACIVWDNGGRRYSVDWKMWTPKRSLSLYPEDDRAILVQAAEEGVLELLESKIVDTDVVFEWIKNMAPPSEIKRIGTDPWHANRLTMQLEDQGYSVLQVSQTTAKLTDPIGDVEKNIIAGNVTHPAYRILSWMVENAVVVSTRGKFLSKPDGEPHRKIDGLDAMVSAFACVDYASHAFAVSDLELEEYASDEGETAEDLMYV